MIPRGRTRTVVISGRIPVTVWRPVAGVACLGDSKPLEDLRQRIMMGWHGAPAGRCVVRVGICTRSMIDIADSVPLIVRLLKRSGMFESGAVERVSVYRLDGVKDQVKVTVRELPTNSRELPSTPAR